MIAGCPQCQARFRLDPDKVGAQGVRLRCSKCQTVFRVPPPGEAAPGPPAPAASGPPAPAASGPPAPAAASAPSAPAAPAPRPSAAPRTEGPKVLVAVADADSAKQVVGVLSRWSLRAEVVHDGTSALLWIYRHRPPAAVLGPHLAGASSPVIVELVKRTAELAHLRLVRIAAEDEPPTSAEFEAVHTVDPAEVAHGVEAALASLELGLRPSGADTPRGAPAPAAAPARSASTPAAPAPRAAPSEADPAVAAAERLARIIVSDILLYNREKFEDGVRSGNLVAALEAELTEASALFKQRIPEEVRSTRDFLREELERRGKSA